MDDPVMDSSIRNGPLPRLHKRSHSYGEVIGAKTPRLDFIDSGRSRRLQFSPALSLSAGLAVTPMPFASQTATSTCPNHRARLEARGCTVKDVRIAAPERYPDCTLLVPEYVGDEQRWLAFHVGRDCVSQASNFMRKALAGPFREQHTREILLSASQVDGRYVESALRGLYGEPCVPTLENVVELFAVLDYWLPAGAPNNYWQNLKQACSQLLTARLNSETACDIWRRALYAGQHGIVDFALPHLTSVSDPGLLELSREELCAFIDNPRNEVSESELLDLAKRWTMRNESTAANSRPPINESLIHCIRWHFIPDWAILNAFSGGAVTAAQTYHISSLRTQISATGPVSSMLFGQPLKRRFEPKVCSAFIGDHVYIVRTRFTNIQTMLSCPGSSMSRSFNSFDTTWNLVLTPTHLVLKIESGAHLGTAMQGQIEFKPQYDSRFDLPVVDPGQGDILPRLVGSERVTLDLPGVAPEAQPQASANMQRFLQDKTFRLDANTRARAWALHDIVRCRDTWELEFKFGPLRQILVQAQTQT